MVEDPWLDADEQEAWRSLQMMQVRLGARLAHDLSLNSGLSFQDYLVLVALTERPEGRARLFELGEWLGWEKSRLSHQVSRMSERGLVSKLACCSDRRGAFVEVTDEGRRQIAEAAPSHVRAVRRLCVDRLSRAQLAQLHAICTAVLRALDDEETLGQVAGCPTGAG